MLCDRGPHFLQQLFQLYVPGARDQDFVERIQDLLMVGDLESRTALVGGTVSPGRSRYRRRGAVRLMAPLESRTEA